MNWFQAGADLLNTVRPGVAGYLVTLCRKGTLSRPFYASSPPSGHNTMTLNGLVLSEFDRVFYWKILDCSLGMPMRGDVITDENGAQYTVRPGEDRKEAWWYHGQNRKSVGVIGRRDK